MAAPVLEQGDRHPLFWGLNCLVRRVEKQNRKPEGRKQLRLSGLQKGSFYFSSVLDLNSLEGLSPSLMSIYVCHWAASRRTGTDCDGRTLSVTTEQIPELQTPLETSGKRRSALPLNRLCDPRHKNPGA